MTSFTDQTESTHSNSKRNSTMKSSSSLKTNLKISRQNNIYLEEDQASQSSLDKSKPLISILSNNRKNSNILTINNSNLDYSSSTLPLSKVKYEKTCVLNKINSQISLNLNEQESNCTSKKETLNNLNFLFVDDTLSRKSSYNSVRFAQFIPNDQVTLLKKDSLSICSSSIGGSTLLPVSNTTELINPLTIQVNNANQSFSSLSPPSDLNPDAELLEASVKRNDKYTVRRILDVHYSFFRIKQQQQQQHSQSQTIPAIFFNILHVAIEHNALDVLRICLKYGLSPNETGVAQKKCSLLSQCKSSNNRARYKLKCSYCSSKSPAMTSSEIKATAGVSIKNNINYLKQKIASQTRIIENIESDESKNQSFDLSPTPTPTETQNANYSSISYLIRLVPLFLSVSKCNHSATELLLTYNACPNVQDEFGNAPLHLAVAKPEPCKECVHLLLKYHATSLVFNNKLQSPLSVLKLITQQQNKLNDPNEINNLKWDYSLSSIQSSLIQDLFKNLELVSAPLSNKTLTILTNSDGLTLSQKEKSPNIDNNNNNNNNIKSFKSNNNAIKKSYTLIHNSNKGAPLTSHSLRNISKIKNYSNSSNSLNQSNENDSSSKATKSEFFVKRMFRNHSSSSEAHTVHSVGANTRLINNLSKSKPKIQKIKSKTNMEPVSQVIIAPEPLSVNLLTTTNVITNNKSKSLINVTSPTPQTQTPVHNIDKQENFLLKKYARYAKASPKSGSAVVRIPTFTHSVKADKINKQNSLSSVMINKFNSIKNSTGALANMSVSDSCKKLDSLDHSNQLVNSNANNNDNISVVSSKISLFKKPVKLEV